MKTKTVDGIEYWLLDMPEPENPLKVLYFPSENMLDVFSPGNMAVIGKALPTENKKKEVIIPEEIDGYPVRTVASYAFYHPKNKWIESICFNSAISIIGNHAFRYYFHNLRVVRFCAKKQRTPIFNDVCFCGCQNLAMLHFSNHEELNEVYLVRKRSDAYWKEQKDLISRILLNSARNAFYGCWKLPTELAEH